MCKNTLHSIDVWRQDMLTTSAIYGTGTLLGITTIAILLEGAGTVNKRQVSL